jgi:FKBP-type peptidyl-prolyl cis-trans isomerase SlyD
MSNESEADEETEHAETEQDGLQEGTFIRLDYTLRTVEDGNLVDTTDPEVAEEEGIDDEEHEFEPRTIVLGEGHVPEPLEDALIGSEVGESGTVTVDAVDAFGEYDESEVKTVKSSRIEEDDRYPGARVNLDGEQGVVETIIGGRARVDFNHPLAGEDIEYEYEVLGEVEDRVEQAKGLLGLYIDLDLDMHIEEEEVEEEQLVEPDEDADEEEQEPEFETVTVEKESLYIEATPQLTMNQQWMFQKQQIAQQLQDKLGIDRVVIQEVIEGPGGMMGGMGGMMGGMGGGDVDLEDALEDADVDLEDADVDADELEEALEE